MSSKAKSISCDSPFKLFLFFCTKLGSVGRFEDQTKESNRVADQAECDIRDFGKKVHGFEIEFDETNDKLNKALESLEEKEKHLKEVEADIAALTRRIMLMEEEAKKSEQTLANTVTKLAVTSKVGSVRWSCDYFFADFGKKFVKMFCSNYRQIAKLRAILRDIVGENSHLTYFRKSQQFLLIFCMQNLLKEKEPRKFVKQNYNKLRELFSHKIFENSFSIIRTVAEFL
jgi:hypothetical protein